MPFPPGFRWGAATSGHQTEDGNTSSDTWFLEHVRPSVFRQPSGRACNSYELWRADVDLVAGLGPPVTGDVHRGGMPHGSARHAAYYRADPSLHVGDTRGLVRQPRCLATGGARNAAG